MIRPTLATVDGALVSAVFVSPRFVSIGGNVLDYAQRQARPTLADAQAAFRGYQSMLADWAYPERTRQQLAREALALAAAIEACCAHRRAAGWANPNDADRERSASA